LLAAAVLTIIVALPTVGQDRSSQGVPEDWTHHHAVFGDAGTAVEAIRNGTYDRWLKIITEPRYQLARANRIAAARTETTIHQDELGTDSDLRAGTSPEEALDDARVLST